MTLEAYQSVLAALAIWREARGESHEAQLGVYWCMLNRSHDPQRRWPSTVVGIVLQPKQFSSFNSGDPNATKFPVVNDAAFVQCCAIVDAPGLSDPTLGANHYFSGDHVPEWADPKHLTATIGAFKFFRL